MSARTRNLLLFFVIVAIIALPTLLLSILGLSSAGVLSGMAATSGVFAALSRRWSGLFWGAGVTTVGVFLGVLVAEHPLASAALLLAVGLTFGLAYRSGYSAANLLFPVVIASVIGTPPALSDQSVVNAIASAAVAAGSMLIAGAIVALASKPHTHTPPAISSTKVLAVFTVNLALLLTGIGFVAAQYHAQVPGMWLAMTVMMVVRPYVDVSITRGIHRAIGTLLGFLIALGVATAVPASNLYSLIGLVFIASAMLIKMEATSKYWEYVMFLTPGVVLLSGLPSEITQYADWRLFATTAAAAASLLLLGAERLLFYRGSLNEPVRVAAE